MDMFPLPGVKIFASSSICSVTGRPTSCGGTYFDFENCS